MGYECLIIERHGSTEVVRLNRPEALNALNSVMMGELATALVAAESDAMVRAIVIIGSDKAFAAGADVREMADKTFAEAFFDNLYGREVAVISALRKPIIAAVAGFCLGGGCELAMLCDFIIAAESAKFGQPEINLGIVAGMGGTQRLTRAVGKAKSMDMHLTGRFMDAAEAERASLVSRIVPNEALLTEALAAAAKIGEKSALAVRAVKESVARAQEVPLAEGLLFERRMFHAMFATADQKEGMAAFLEKRTASFKDC